MMQAELKDFNQSHDKIEKNKNQKKMTPHIEKGLQ
jgi:hypothetical protein